MPKRVPGAADGIVLHPRFGDRSVPSGNVAPDEAEAADSLFWRYSKFRVATFPDSVIPADVSRQHYGAFPLTCYVDVLRPCRGCGRPFIFFAREQKYWYEVLGFYIWADCIHCVECRRANHRLRRRFQRYSRQIGRDDLSDPELATLVEDAVFLHEQGVLRNEQRLRTLKNLAVARIPGTPAAEAVLGAIAKIQAREIDDGPEFKRI